MMFHRMCFIVLISQRSLLTKKLRIKPIYSVNLVFSQILTGVDFSLTLARKLIEGELSGGTNSVRSQALAWCVRILSRTEELDKAEKYLEYAKKLGS